MKNLVLAASAMLVLLTACSKNDDSPPSVTTPTSTFAISATVNGSQFNAPHDQSLTSKNSTCFVLLSKTLDDAQNKHQSITLQLLPSNCGKAGTYSVQNQPIQAPGTVALIYWDGQNNYAGISGNVVVSRADTTTTNPKGFKNFEATFTFITETKGSTSYTVTNGHAVYP